MIRTISYFAHSAAAAALLLAVVRGAIAQDNRDTAPTKPSPSTDLTCGPRCVQGILCLYGKPREELLDLVREIQWPDLENGATLLSLDKAFRKRELNTYAMTISGKQRLRWPHPVVVHMKGGAGGGHYVVWVPSGSSDYDKIWGGVGGGWTSVPRDVFAGTRSGAILLTSPVPITHPESATDNAGDASIPAGWSVVVVVAGIMISALAVGRDLRRHRGPVPTSTPNEPDVNTV